MDRSVLPPFEQSDWAAPIVIPKKTEQTVSNGCVLDPSPEDFNLSDAYLQTKLDEESKKVLVINTH
ncbi:hypothetical protein M514_19518 [Trichuris suis]|uniref:Uncharacterized protein n=1 Tax=Trichuris suis TaxID=68888 RepID=A0A085NFL0_9BILA|nr:hypothetical protein M514_19518 [Trichuris suis]